MSLENPFKWHHFKGEITLLCVRWYLRYALSYRDLEEMMLERGLEVDHAAIHSKGPRVINVDKNAAYPPAMNALKKDGCVDKACKLRQVKYLNNIVEQDHRFIKRRVAPGLGFGSFRTADRALRGYEAMNIAERKKSGDLSRFFSLCMLRGFSHKTAKFLISPVNPCHACIERR